MSVHPGLAKNLKIILGNEVESNIISYITDIKNIEDFEEFMENIVDKVNPEHVKAYTTIRDILFGVKQQVKQGQTQNQKSTAGSSNQHMNKKEKKKFRDINTYQEKKKAKEGRHACDCLGQEHGFLNNCLQCGRIHCEDEGPGPCLFCGNPIPTRNGFRGGESIDKKSKGFTKYRENKVFDDDNDYFKINNKKNNKESKKKMIVALDFATRRIIEGSQEDAKIRQRLLNESMEHLKKVDQMYENLKNQAQSSYKNHINMSVNDELISLLIQMRHKKPVGNEDLGPEDNFMPVLDYGLKVFDEDLMANVDHGMCLSMHQPYASLLVAGVKKHEGRTWPTTHRGRLWVAAAAKQPDEDEVTALESFYRNYYQDTTLKFPKEYPVSCLLGCVYVEDCLEEEIYRKKYPQGESNSPYVLICSNPVILPIFYPIVGKHKIYSLDKELHKCAKIALQHAKYI